MDYSIEELLEKGNIKDINVNAVSGKMNFVQANNIETTGIKVIIQPISPAERLPEHWNVPPKNENFVGRGELLKQITDYFSQGDKPLVLTAVCGLGGIGKTQVALEFVWQHYKEYNGAVWFNAESKGRLQQDYIRLGRELHILREEEMTAEEQACYVKHWLEHPSRAGWLLVYDNAPQYGGEENCGLFVTSTSPKQDNSKLNDLLGDFNAGYIFSEKDKCFYYINRSSVKSEINIEELEINSSAKLEDLKSNLGVRKKNLKVDDNYHHIKVLDSVLLQKITSITGHIHEEDKGIGKLLPTKKGKLIITSRYASGWPQESFAVDVFTLDESREYIHNILDSQLSESDKMNIDTLAETLCRLPLALAQASAYIKYTKMSISRYLGLYEQKKRDLLNSKILPSDYRASIYITWDITMEEIRKKSLLAFSLLNICACLASNDIPNFLLEKFANTPENNSNSEIFEETLGTLNCYSMLSINVQKRSSSIHRLVQEVIRLKWGKEKNT